MTSLSRRQFLQRTVAGSLLATMPILAQAQRPTLNIPPLIDVGRGRPVILNFRPTQFNFEPNKLVDVWGVNGHYIAPTVRVRSNQFIKLTYHNSLPQPLSVAIQGLLTPTNMLGSSQRKLAPNESWSPIVNINQNACTCWYHADTLFNSAFQTYRGIAGFWLIEDDISRKLALPNDYGKNDIPLILQDQRLNSKGEQVLDTQNPQFFGNRLFVNGQEAPQLTVARGWVRLRLLNASLSRAYHLSLDNGAPLYLIATGLGYLAKPIELAQIQLAPSERVEVLVNLNEGGAVSLITGEKRGFLHAIEQWFTDENTLIDNRVLTLNPEGFAAVFNDVPPLGEFNFDDFALKIALERKFLLHPLDKLINQQRFDPKRIDFEAKLGSVERWYLTSVESVGFGIQGAKFIVETRGGRKVPTKYLAWNDTLWLNANEQTTILVKFDQAATTALPMSYGVTDLMLKDRGCQGQFSVS